MEKLCNICKVIKPLNCFNFRKDTQKYRNECKECKKIHNKNYLQSTNYKKGEQRFAKKIEINKSEYKACTKCGVSKSITCFQKRTDTKHETYRNDCLECRNAYVAEFKRTSEKSKKRQNERQKERRATDPCFLMNQRIRSRLGTALKAQNTRKNTKLCELLGCTIPEFKDHIEKQFKPGMSWQERNFVIDHIIPCSYFDLSKVEHQKLCFHYTNMQPLTEKENSDKSDKILPEFEHRLKLLKL